MELTSMLAGGRFTDRPVSVCPVIGALLRVYNDAVGDGPRQDLYRYAADCVGTRGDYAVEHERAIRVLAWGRARYEERARLRRVPDPGPYAGPEYIAEHVVASIRRHTNETHTSMLCLLDQLMSIGQGTAAPATGAPWPARGAQPRTIRVLAISSSPSDLAHSQLAAHKQTSPPKVRLTR
jgi:hypothetical protein